VGVAAFVSRRGDQLAVPRALLAAFAGGCVMTVGTLAIVPFFGGRPNASYAWMVFCHLVNGGAVIGFPVTVGVSALARWPCSEK
jgi:hypothetical protein